MQDATCRAGVRVFGLAIIVAILTALSGCPTGVREPAPRPPVPRTPQPPTAPPKELPPAAITGTPTQVALLLPLSGRQQSAGIAVRDGFFAAYYQQDPARRPRVRVYDIGENAGTNVNAATGSARNASDIAAHYLRAIDHGAQFIVGPLTKDDVGAAADIADGRVPTLALNFMAEDKVVPRNFYQFALSPEDEARQAARRILADGHKRGVALVPAGDWGTRILNAFAEELTTLGGQMISRGTYVPSESDHSPVILSLLRLTDSRERHQRLTATLGTKLEFQPRRRGDVEFIFVAAQPSQGRLIRPQLRFHYAGDIPMYTTSEVYEPDDTENVDLDGVMFPDMPWMISYDPGTTKIRDSLQQVWPNRFNRRGRLYAFGVDAYRLIPLLSSRNQRNARPTNDSFNGATGRLNIDPEGRIRRNLDWALIRDGKPRALPSSSTARSP